MSQAGAEDLADGVAVIGMAGRFPGARNVTEFWDNLAGGVESISEFPESELEASRFEPPEIRSLGGYVRARAMIEDADKFDAAFFGFTPRDAALMDPQHRLFLEVAWSAVEDAGYDPVAYAGSIGVWAGSTGSTYLLENLLARCDVLDQVGLFQARLANEKDYLATRVSYKLNLRGPSVNVSTACSTSLVAVCQACHALQGYQCDMALAGGVSVTIPQRQGYLYVEGGILSRDGHCRPFDAEATGTASGDGVGVVVLKRLADALEDGDTIHAVIRGAALNNDGSGKVSFTAPSVDGQAEVIAMAQALAGVDPGTISYVEAHGTATPLGDPIEIAALTEVFRAGTTTRNFCAIGSVKSNVGHLDAAAGVAGLIKTVLALRHRMIPPSLHFTRPNPQIDFAASPFFVNAELRPWTSGATPRRAGVSAFGIGGTNAHVVLEEAPETTTASASRPEQLLLLSAKTEAVLGAATVNLAGHLREHPRLELADVAHTLRAGRRPFGIRRALVAHDAAEAAAILASDDPTRLFTGACERPDPAVVFMFPGGQGVQQVGASAELYRREPVFRSELDGCAEALLPHLGLDIRPLILAVPAEREAAERRLGETWVSLPALFAVEYALARLWMAWGVAPAFVVGHSLGEYAAACLAGVLSREDAAALVVTRSRLQGEQPPGAMLAVWMSASDLAPRLGPDLAVAGFNAPEQTVVAGSESAVRALERSLTEIGVTCRALPASHAYHSPAMDGALAPFRQSVTGVRFSASNIPWVSTLTGDWMTPELATDPEYWVRQLRQPVRFSDAVRKIAERPDVVFLEVGPGHTLSSLVRQHRGRPESQAVVTSLGPDPTLDVRAMLEAVGRLWIAGVKPDWAAICGSEKRRRVSLPTYPFERRRHWIDAPPPDTRPGAEGGKERRAPRLDEADSVAAPPGDSASPSNESPVARRVRQMMSEVSGIPPAEIRASRSLLEMGFDSLLLVQVSALAERTFGVGIPLRQLLDELPTPAALTAHLEARLGASASAPRAGGVSPLDGPPVPGARLGRDAAGKPAWFVPDPDRPGKYLQVTTDAEHSIR